MSVLKEDTLRAMACARCGYAKGTQPYCEGMYCEKWMSLVKASDLGKAIDKIKKK